MIGILCGIKSEYKIFKNHPNARVFCNRRGAIEMAADDSFKCLVSIGIGGALSSGLSVGDIIVADAVKTESKTYYTDNNLTDAIIEKLFESNDFRFKIGSIFSHETLVAGSPAFREWFYHKYGTIAIDQESCAVGAFAEKLGIPFVSIRCISDDVEDHLPQAVDCIEPDGSTNYFKLIKSLALDVGQIHDLVALVPNYRKSLKNLEKCYGLIKDLF
jgi:adenosylhomocysteine nucleosidase